MPKLERYLDIRNVATRKNMGRDYAIDLVKKYLEHFKGKECYVLKLDVSKYFYSIDHDILRSMLRKDLTEEEMNIMDAILKSTNYAYINRSIEKLKNSALIKASVRKDEIEAIPFYEKDKGLPIGNMSSQFLSIYYLNELDHKIIHDYHLKYYVRYMDDIVIFSDNKKYLSDVLNIIKIELKDKYNLKVNENKTSIVNIKEGINFCGYRFRIINNKTVINVVSGTKYRIKKHIKRIKNLYSNGSIGSATVFSSINTYYNGFKYGSYNKMRRIVDKYFFSDINVKN